MAHIHEKIDISVTVYVVFGDKVLLRMHEKYKQWFGPGGHVELDEDPNEAAVREVKEEIGLAVELWEGNQRFQTPEGDDNRQLIPPVGLQRHHTSPSHEHVDHVYFARAKTDDVQVAYDGDRSDEWRWLTSSELGELGLRPDVEFYARGALEALASQRASDAIVPGRKEASTWHRE
jgi:8-oxo-dGTP pyrophosphatase MutT (NUDIX family)